MEAGAAQALEIYVETRAAGKMASASQVIAAFKACGSLNRLDTGREIHAQLLQESVAMIHRNTCVATTLVDMYAKCGSIGEAIEIFQTMGCRRSVVTWNCIILGCAHAGDFSQALDLYSRMDCPPNHVTFLAALKACIGLAEEGEKGRKEENRGGRKKVQCLEKIRTLHKEAIRVMASGIHVFVANSLITAYSKCGSLREALDVFQGMREHSVVSWTEIIMGYAGNGGGKIALQLYDQMLAQDFSPSRVTLLAALKACCCSSVAEEGDGGGNLERGKAIHSRAVRDGHDSQVLIASSLVDMYFKCRSLVDALTVFGSMVDPTVVSWNCVIMGNVLSGEAGLALDLYGQMQEQGFTPDAATFVAALKACVSLAGREQGKLVGGGKLVRTKCLALGREIHGQAAAASSGGELHVFVANGLIDMYAKCGSMIDGWKVFQSMPVRSLVSWNCVIFGFAESGDGKRSLELYRQMQDEGCSPNYVSYIAALKACVALVESADIRPDEDSKLVKLECSEKVQAIHSQAGRDELHRHRFLANAMVAAYAKCGGLNNAREIFESLGQDRDLVTWNSMILGYAESGDGKEALKLYEQMEHEGCAPDDLTYLAALKACSSLVDEQHQEDSNVDLQERAGAIRRRAAARREGLSVFVANTLIDFYARCRLIAEAREVFESMRDRSVVSWNCIILGLAENGFGRQALGFYARMHDEGFAPDTVTFIAALKACGSLGDMEAGRRIRLEVVSAGLDKDPAVANSLLDFYGKCGSMGEAVEAFESMEKKSMVSWNALMDGYSRQGDYERVLELFERMKELRLRPNETTFLVLLNACCHGGLVEAGKALFEAMAGVYGISPGLKHYSAMVDLFGRANRMDEAVRMVKSMRMEPNAVIWMTLLGACSKWKDVRVGEFAFTSAVKVLVPARNREMYAAACVMMSNIYAITG